MNSEPRFKVGDTAYVLREEYTIARKTGVERYRLGVVQAQQSDGYYEIQFTTLTAEDTSTDGDRIPIHAPSVTVSVHERYLRSPDEMKEAMNRPPVVVPNREYDTTAIKNEKIPAVDDTTAIKNEKIPAVDDIPEGSAELLEATLEPPTETAFTKFDHDKPHLAYLPIEPLEAVARVLDYGAVKYDRDNWKKCDDPMRYMSAAMRHQFAWLKGEQLDPETGQNHLAHALCSLMFLLWMDMQEK